jgi:hypothetical protein
MELSKPTKGLLIFDFDQTLSNQHLFSKFKEDLVYFENLYKLDEDKEKFQKTYFNDFDKTKKLFDEKHKDGYQICIASFGYQKMLKKFIEFSYGHDIIPEKNIIGSDGIQKNHMDFDENKGWSSRSLICELNDKYKGPHCKNHMIIHFMKMYNVQSPNVIFFDDDKFNVLQAKKI